ncbi:NAD(P)H-dependent glycerol-3-phosphate dehydrogenase [Granulicatella sp. zg-ZJ]|uniref:NAD(P)H-dependent glycerol-3-phosphate dehydrogenase n=1 Tax=unclassified Granulicatella TaxID=2630493 RepID=UPI0013C2415D|nr:MULTISPECIES: NAD(P)H-dependent glycerol-3-phosphate dehydrogenase [unclassified Granulicatella]MBS4750488.1 NAD(P)H-dependent glycerol-3-phosphate dehydrogenase [Carnobacteriaceae bacterium zg-ZUI78]NEW62568.1 NAD(P)H-dependent glycerol-3-phosphate dehydrogenase [Granulicatella sp. zg-ZJ]NEW66117.1 NAD(P)H-dependent glycerol-3-phosphate dehydrogenase [Granulicatella sp. zg-84]QMI85442.1 NAD(P)H-dependent glycerol-3-phosphate dehydrogenase [Carnobacteriaceae bacterium zg-84]
MKQKIAVLGAGSWGTALATCLVENGHDVCLWGNNQDDIDCINEYHKNERYLKDILLPEQLRATINLNEALEQVDCILFVVPTNAIRQVAQQVNMAITSKPYIVHASKGLEQGSHKRISQILSETLDKDVYKDIVVLSGPSHAEEVARKDLTTITAACQNNQSAKYVQSLFMNKYFRIYTNEDVVGVEYGAALKNIIALGAGIVAGLGYGDNAKAALVTRGLAEITRFGMYFGAEPLTFIGLSGVGDLIVTCTSVHSRNWQLGYRLGKGLSLQEAMEEIDMAVEGVWTTKATYEIAHQEQIDMPITKAIYEVLYHNKNVKQAIVELMARDGKSEEIKEIS